LPIANCQLKGRAGLRLKLAIRIWQLATGLCLVAASAAQTHGNSSSLPESKIDGPHPAGTPETLREQSQELQRQLAIAQESLKALTSSLAESNAAAELFRRKYSDLELQMEALGLAAASKDRAKLEQRLLAAVSDLQLAHKERDQYRDQLLRLSEAILRYLKTSQGGDAQARMDVEAQLRSANNLVATGAHPPDASEPSLMDGSVISVKEEWSFIVANLGEKHGVKIGMPMRVMRGDQKIATVRVVDVRQKICGAVIQEMDSKKEKIRVGDRLQVDAQPDVSLK
jgi:multidrug efflux pump subunit AcrA (membrane-fusion protein)